MKSSLFRGDGPLIHRRRHDRINLRAFSRSSDAVFAITGPGYGEAVPLTFHESTDWLLHADLYEAYMVCDTDSAVRLRFALEARIFFLVPWRNEIPSYWNFDLELSRYRLEDGYFCRLYNFPAREIVEDDGDGANRRLFLLEKLML